MKKIIYLTPITILILMSCGTDSSIGGSGEENTDVCLFIEESKLKYLSSEDIYGFQFSHDGCASSAVAGSDSNSAGFSVTANSSTVIGFSMMGNFIPSGTGALIEGLGCEEISNIVISGIGGTELSSEIESDCSQ